MTLRQISQKYKFKPLTIALASIIFIAPIANAENVNTIDPSNTITSGIAPSANPAVNTATPTPSATTTSVKVTSPTMTTGARLPLNQPNMTDNAIINWAIDAARSTYSYDFKNFLKQMQMNQQYFTAPGWSAFMAALEKSNNLKVVQEKKLVASAVPTGRATIVNQGVKNGVYTWKIEIPMTATYENESKLIKQNLLVTMLVSRNNSPSGVGISHFVAVVQPAGQAPMTTPTTISTPSAGTPSTSGTTTPATTNIYNSPTTGTTPPVTSTPGIPSTPVTTPGVTTATPSGTPSTSAPTPSGTMPNNGTTPGTMNATPPAAGFGAPAGTVGSPAAPGTTGPGR